MTLKSFLDPVLQNIPAMTPDKEIEMLRMLPSETLFMAMKEANSESALWVMENVKASQMQGVVDLDCWKGDEFLPDRFFKYFEYMTYTTPEKLSEFMSDLDPEVIVLSLMNVIDVLDFDPQNPPEHIADDKLMYTPDGKYAIVLKSEDPDLRERLGQWFNKMSMMDMDLMRRHLESLKWESKSDAENFAYQIKKGRIEELGFLEREEAIHFYSVGQAPTLKKHLLENPLHKSVKEEAPLLETIGSEEFLPLPLSKAVREEGFFRESLALVENPHLKDLLRMEVVRTINAVFTADDILSEELDVLKVSAGKTRQYLDLGLLYLAGGIKEKAKEIIETQAVFNIARLGWILIQDLVRAAKEVREKFSLGLFENIDRELLKALQGRHPDFTHPDLIQSFDIDLEKPFKLENIHKIASRLGALSLLGSFFNETLGTSLKTATDTLEEKESAWTRLCTGIFRQACSREFSVASISKNEFQEIKAQFDATLFQKLSGLIEAKIPDLAKPLFTEHMTLLLEDIQKAVAQKEGPDSRYFRSIRLEGK